MTADEQAAMLTAASAAKACGLPLPWWVRLRAAMVELIGSDLPPAEGKLDAAAARVLAWQKATFGGHGQYLAERARHLHEESAELLVAVRGESVFAREELADVVILAIGLAASMSVDLAAEVESKMDQNEARSYRFATVGKWVRE